MDSVEADELLSELKVKEQRVRNLLAECGYQSLLITTREQFAWFTGGGRAVVSHMDPTSPVYLLITPTRKYAIGMVMDLPRTFAEELQGQGYEPVSVPTFSQSLMQTAIDLAVAPLASDGHYPGIENIEKRLTLLHEPFTPREMMRYQNVAGEAARILFEVACQTEPGMTEQYVLSLLWGKFIEHGFDGNCMFVGSDERFLKYRHCVASQKKIEKTVLLAPAVVKYGLNIPISRMVIFGEPTEEQRKRHEDLCAMQAAILANSQPGVYLHTVLDKVFSLFDYFGYPEEKTNHLHGGPIGYHVSYPERCLDQHEIIHPGMAMAWYLTVKGAKTEEPILVDDSGSRLISLNSDWPLTKITWEGKEYLLPDLLVR